MNTVAPSTVYRRPADLVTNGTAPGARAQLLSEINGRSTYALVLARDDEVATALMDFASSHHIAAAHFTAIGALRDVKLAWYDLERKAYKIISVDGQVEALSLLGDVGLANGKPAVHCHMTVGLEDGTVRGGPPGRSHGIPDARDYDHGGAGCAQKTVRRLFGSNVATYRVMSAAEEKSPTSISVIHRRYFNNCDRTLGIGRGLS